MKWYETLLNYATQKSTWVGLIAIIAAFGLTIKPELSDAIVTFLLAGFGLIQVIVNDRAGTTTETKANKE